MIDLQTLELISAFLRKDHATARELLSAPNIKVMISQCTPSSAISPQDKAICMVLSQACEYGWLDIVKILLDIHPDLLNTLDALGQTPLFHAASQGHFDVVNHLVLAGIDINVAMNVPNSIQHGYTAIYWAISQGHDLVVRCLLNAGAETEFRIEHNQFHLIHIAACSGHLNVIKLLLETNPHWLNLPDELEQTPLLWAASLGHVDVVKHLCLQKDIDLNGGTNRSVESIHGFRPFLWAIKNGHVSVAKCLIDAGAIIDMALQTTQIHPIHIAAQEGQLEMVRWLLSINPSWINKADVYGQTPVYWATKNGHCQLVQHLLANGAANDNLLIFIAINEGHVELIEFFCANKAHWLVQVNALGQTPLGFAIANAQPAVAYQMAEIMHNELAQVKIIDDLQTLQHVLTFISLLPKMATVLYKNERIMALICEEKQDPPVTRKYYSTGLKRQPSFFTKITDETGDVSIFSPKQTLGAGTYGVVRDFVSSSGEHVAVKSLKERFTCSEDDLKKQELRIHHEAKLIKQAYPDSNLTTVFNLKGPVDTKGFCSYTNRLTTKFIEGETADQFLTKISCENKLAKIVLLMVDNLRFLHDKKIGHGDIKLDNIMVSEQNDILQVQFIDFGLSYHLDEPYLRIRRGQRYAPELRTHATGIIGLPTHDIYAFAYMLLDEILLEHKLGYALACKFPCLVSFIDSALDRSPSARPTLSAFHQELSEAYQAPIMDMSSSLLRVTM